MSEYTPTTEAIREYVETGGEPRPWVELDETEQARERDRVAAFDRWLAAHDAEVRAGVVAEEPEQSRASVFIQYKGTDICLDFHCICERDEDEGGHFDGYFAHTLKCGRCGRLYEMPHTLELKLVETSDHEPRVIHPDGEGASRG